MAEWKAGRIRSDNGVAVDGSSSVKPDPARLGAGMSVLLQTLLLTLALCLGWGPILAATGGFSAVYDLEGNRTRKTAGGVTTHFLVATVNPTGWPQVVEEHTGTNPGTVTRRYTYGADLISQSRTNSSAWHTDFFLTDGLGSTRALLNSSGGISDTYTFDAFGNLLTAASSGTTPNHYRYTGEQWDNELGMYYLRARYMSPAMGRFWSRDTFEGHPTDPLSLHRYLYVHGNPVNGVDPSGHQFTIASTMSAVGNGFWIATRLGSTGYAAYSRVEWLKDGVEFLSATVTTGTVDPVALGLWASDFIPIGRVAGKIGRVTGIGKHLAQVRGALQGIGNKAKEQLGLLAANAVARAKGFRPTNFAPRGNGGFDGVFKDGDNFVIVESKFGLNPHLNPGTVSNPSQMSQVWIEKNIRDLREYDPGLAMDLQEALNNKKIKAMVVKTRVGANGEIRDPEFDLKDWGEIGIDSWTP